MISNEQLGKIIKDCETTGHTIKVKDISYVLLCRSYDDVAVAYKVLFDTSCDNNTVMSYHKSESISFLRSYMEANYPEKQSVAPKHNKKKKENIEDITFDENKEALIKMIREVEQKEASGELDANQSAQLRTKLRIALNDKFQVKEDVKEQLVIVNAKYNEICPYCSHELYIPTKEDLIKKYNLIEKDNSNG
jgi:uncharacterized protein YjgD (DUF1641 family)